MPEYVPGQRKWYEVGDGKRGDFALLLPQGPSFMGHVLQFNQVKYWREIVLPADGGKE